MTRTKKLLALVLALMMAISCMAVPAMALENGAARNSIYCGTCHKYQPATHTPDTKHYTTTRTVGGCSKTNLSHDHTIVYYYCEFICPDCELPLATHTHTYSETCHYDD